MDQEAQYRVRLRVAPRIGLTTGETTLTFSHRGRPVSLKSQTRQQPLSEAKWWIVAAHGFATEAEARAFGEELRSAIQIAALCTHLGVDAGQDQATSWMSETFAQAVGAIEPRRSLAVNAPEGKANKTVILLVRAGPTLQVKNGDVIATSPLSDGGPRCKQQGRRCPS